MIESPRYFLHLHLNPTFKNDSIFFWNSRSQIPFTNSPLGVPVRRVVTQKAPKPVLRVCSVAAFVVFYTEFWNRILWFHDQFFYSYYYCYQLLLAATTNATPYYSLLPTWLPSPTSPAAAVAAIRHHYSTQYTFMYILYTYFLLYSD